MTTIGIAVGTMNATLAIASYFELIDTVSSDVSKLLHQSFKSARMNLELAQTSSELVQQKEYLKEARNKFIEAIAVEKDENLVSAYAGLTMCQLLLGDNANAQLTLKKISQVELSKSEKTKSAAKGFAKVPVGGLFVRTFGVLHGVAKREAGLKEYKERVVKELRPKKNSKS